MLVDVCLSPEVFRPAPGDDATMRLQYSVLLSVLHDLTENGVILVDQDNNITSEMFGLADAWPVKYRKPMKEVLTKLRSSGRLFKLEEAYTASLQCCHPACGHCNGVCTVGRPAALIIPDDCTACLGRVSGTVEIVPLPDYQSSRLVAEMRSRRHHQVANGSWSKSKFEQLVLVPVLRTAKNLKIFDRYIGRTMLRREGGIQRLSPRFAEPIEWIVGVFMRESSRRRGVCEIYCGFEGMGQPESVLESVRREVSEWRDRMRAQFGYPVEVVVKCERPGESMPHARYLVTDQVGVLVDTGFDLFLTDAAMRRLKLDPRRNERRIRDVVLALCPTYREVERDVRRLSDL